jgi:glutamate carboxypeptidase
MTTDRAAAILRWTETHEAEAIGLLETLVNQDSGTFDPAGVNRVADRLAETYAALGFSVRRHVQEGYGDHLEARREGGSARALLCLGHLDTVFPAGAAAVRPFRIEGRRATGPGVADMKGGLTVLLFALRALRDTASPVLRDVTLTVFLNADEEIGSPSSRQRIEELAKSHDAALVLEPARPGGECVIGRKGVGHFRLEVFGRQAHAGSQPEAGINAIAELAHKICALHALTDLECGTTVNVGTVRGGERANVVPDRAEAEVDLRVWSHEEAARLTEAFQVIAAQAHVPGTTARLTGEVTNPPWQTTEGTRALLRLLNQAARPLGLSVPGVTTGGGSDGSRAAQLIPTLDGLGPVGSRLHSPEEFLELPSLRERTALLALFLEAWHARGES